MNRDTRDQVDALRQEIAHTRAELGETVQELAARADVPARAKEQVRRVAQRARTAGSSPQLIAGAAASVAAVVAAVVLWSRRDRDRSTIRWRQKAPAGGLRAAVYRRRRARRRRSGKWWSR